MKRRAPWIVLAVALVMGALVIVFALASPADGERTGAQRVNRAAPGVRATTIDGVPVDLATWRGRWVVVNFFNSTCIPCVAEHPELLDFAAAHPETQLVTVVNDDSDDNVRRWFAANGGSWPVVGDPDGETSVAFGVTGVPETFLIDPAGMLRLRWVGQTTSAALSEWIAKLGREAVA